MEETKATIKDLKQAQEKCEDKIMFETSKTDKILNKIFDKLNIIELKLTTNDEKTNNLKERFNTHVSDRKIEFINLSNKIDNLSNSKVSNKVFYVFLAVVLTFMSATIHQWNWLTNDIALMTWDIESIKTVLQFSNRK